MSKKRGRATYAQGTSLSPFRFTLDEGISRGLSPLTGGRQVDQTLVDEAWRIVVSEIRNAADMHTVVMTDKAITWLADAYFRVAIRLTLTDGTNAFDHVRSTNNVELASLSDDDVSALLHHMKGSVFEKEVWSEQQSRRTKGS